MCRGCGAYTQPGNGKGDAYPYCKACHPGAIQRRWTRGRVLAAMRQWRARYGRLPSSVEEDAERLIQHLVTRGRKASTTIGYESYLRVHVAKLFAEKQIAEVTKQDIEEFIAVCLDNDQSIKSTRNYLGFLHSVFDFGLRKGWVVANPCKAVEKPEAADEDQDIRFLDQTELDALLAATTAPRSRRKAGTAERARQVRRLRPREAAVEADRGGARDR